MMRKTTPSLWVVLLSAVLLLAGLPCAQAADQEEGIRSGELWSGCWEISLLGHGGTGRFCWLSGPDQEIRVEISQEDVYDSLHWADVHSPWLEFLPPLFDRAGQGWTAVLGSDQSGTLQAWGREWQALQPALRIWIRTLLGALQRLGVPLKQFDLPAGVRLLASRECLPGSSRIWARTGPDPVSPASLRLELPAFKVEQEPEIAAQRSRRGFRRDMAARGRGRGGEKEILSLLVQTSKAANLPGVEKDGIFISVTSSRKPGKLVLAIRPGLPVVFYFPEIFSPLWPLAELVEIAP